MRLLAKNPQERGASMGAIAAEFEMFGSPHAALAETIGSDGVVTTRQRVTPRPFAAVADTTLGASAGAFAPQRRSRSKYVIATGLIVAAGIASATAVILSHNRDAPIEQAAAPAEQAAASTSTLRPNHLTVAPIPEPSVANTGSSTVAVIDKAATATKPEETRRRAPS